MKEIYIFSCDLINNQTFIDVLRMVLPTLISTGIITAILSHWYNKKLRTHEIKLKKYINLIEELAKLAANDADWEKLRVLLNEALLFASDEVVGEILEFNKRFTQQREQANGNNFQMTARDIQALVVAIRKELYLKSRSIKKSGLVFFQKPK